MDNGNKVVELIGLSDKRQITAVFCSSFLGEFLPVQLIFKGNTNRCHSSFVFPAGWDIRHFQHMIHNRKIPFWCTGSSCVIQEMENTRSKLSD